MGRPLKKRYFLKNSDPSDVVKYEAVTASINAGGTLYSQGAIATISAPNDPAGVTATIALTITPSTGVISSAALTNVGSGYNTNPTITITTATGQSVTANGAASTTTLTVNYSNNLYVGMKAIGTGINASATYISAINGTTLTLTQPNASTITNATINFVDVGSGGTFNVGLTAVETLPNSIQMTAYITTGSSAVTSAIIKQEGARSYLVENNQGRSRVKLACTDALTAGTAKVIATDSAGATYFVKKFNGRKATLVNRTSTSSAVVVTTTDVAPIGTSATIYTSGIARWTTGTAYTYWENTNTVYAKAIPVVSIATNTN